MLLKFLLDFFNAFIYGFYFTYSNQSKLLMAGIGNAFI